MSRLILVAMAVLILSCACLAQTLTPLINQPPNGVQLTLLLTDGTVMGQDYNNPAYWWKLTPDINGSYVNGTWTQLASLDPTYAPTAFASAVLADGRVIIEGGEYTTINYDFTLTNHGAIYDPATDRWSTVAPPDGLDYIGDSPSVVLPNGRFLLGAKLTKQMFEFDPKTMKWSTVNATGKRDFNAEEGWTLLPDGSVMTADVKRAPNSEIYNPKNKKWRTAGSTIVALNSPPSAICVPYPPAGHCYYPPGEIGPAILRPDGTVFFTGSYPNSTFTLPGNTAIYDTVTRDWSVGPIFPITAGLVDSAADQFSVLLPDGNVLVEGDSGLGYEFDGTNLTLTTNTNISLGSLMVLPTGEVLAGGFGLPGYPTQIYASVGTYQSSWAPTISHIESRDLNRGRTYRTYGTQFNGLSQAAAFGDEYQCSTNYPLVRITNNETNHVFYARTHDHSSMGVATGSQQVWTYFDVPITMEKGAGTLEVVANGIPSMPVSVFVH